MRLRELLRWNQRRCGWNRFSDWSNLARMTTPATIVRRSSRPPVGEEPTFRAMVLYEMMESALCAKALLECVQSDMESPPQFEVEFWRFDWLRERSLRDIALSIAGNSDLIIVATATAAPLPLEMERLLDAWAGRCGDPCLALIAIHSWQRTNRTRYELLNDRLQRAAQAKGVEFFCEPFKAGAVLTATSARLRANAEKTLPYPALGRRWEYQPEPCERSTGD